MRRRMITPKAFEETFHVLVYQENFSFDGFTIIEKNIS